MPLEGKRQRQTARLRAAPAPAGTQPHAGRGRGQRGVRERPGAAGAEGSGRRLLAVTLMDAAWEESLCSGVPVLLRTPLGLPPAP